MLNVEKLKPNTKETLISRVYNYSLEKRLHTLLDKNFLSVKYVMENYIKVEEGNTKKGHLGIHVRAESQPRHQFSTRTSKTSTKGHYHNHLLFHELMTTPLTTR